MYIHVRMCIEQNRSGQSTVSREWKWEEGDKLFTIYSFKPFEC